MRGREKRRRKKFEQKSAQARDRQNGTPLEQSIKIGYWNANGICNIDKKTTLVESMQTEELDILCVAETHLRAGNQEDLSMLSGYYITTLDRTFGEKGGGGMMAIVNPNLNHMIWNSPDERFPELSNEKFWILIHEGGTKVAVGAVYMAAQVTNNDAFKEWNVKLYSMLEHDTRILTDKGYKCFILGDFNGHIGCDEDGITGNKEKTNSNGVLLQQFIKNNALTLLNADPRITAGMFTRTAGGNTTVLDYGLAFKEGVGIRIA